MAGSGDTKWLEQRKLGWYAVVYVPQAQQGILGTKKLRRALGTRDVMVAQRRKIAVVAEFFKQIDAAKAGPQAGRDPVMAEALDWREAMAGARARDASHEDDEGGGEAAIVQDAIQARAEKLRAAGKADITFGGVAQGLATPLLLHIPDWLREGGQKGPFAPRTKLQHEGSLVDLKGWMERAKLAATIEAVGRREAGRFVSEHLARQGRDDKTTARIISTCRTYWRFLLRKGIAPGDANPWDGQAPAKGTSKSTEEERERPFTRQEMVRLLAGPADTEMADLMRVAALTGMRIEEIYRLEVRDCRGGVFNVRKAKSKAGQRRVPMHPALAPIVARRSKAKAETGYLFDEAGPPRKTGERSGAASKRFSHFRKRNDVAVDEVVQGKRGSLVTFHSFRRWFITEALRAGQPQQVVEQIVGHAHQGMTMGVYFGGDLPETLRLCVEAVSLPALPQAA